MMQKLTILWSVLLIAGLYFNAGSQNTSRNYEILFKSGPFTPSENHNQFLNDQLTTTNKTSLNREYHLVQFFKIPANDQRTTLEQLGIKLLDYLPENAYFTSFPVDFDYSVLNGFNIRYIGPIQDVFKLSTPLFEKNYPEWALRGDQNIELRVNVFHDLDIQNISNYLISDNLNPFSIDEFSKSFSLIVGYDEIERIAALPYVMYIETASPEPEPENSTGRTLHRSNVLASSYWGGRQYDGSGVNIMLQDDGIIGPHIDYEGRIGFQYISTNIGDHGDHCAGIIMASGNLDPKGRGMAPGATIYTYGASPNYPGFSSIPQHYVNPGIRISSTSYSDGCNDGYTSLSRTLDQQIRNFPSLMHVFSAGNQGTADCGYGAGLGWGNITGGHKMAKNSIAVANLDYMDNLNSSSSRGPAHDGRIKPDISAKGTDVYSTIDPNSYGFKSGTSMSCPGISGTLAQLYHGYKSLNNGMDPRSALIKAALLNSADDIGNAGPDFKHGYGRANALRAIKTLEEGRYDSGWISQGETINHAITVFENTLQLKVMIYWNDYEGSVNTTKALVNNPDLTIIDPNSIQWLPWVLDHTPDPARLNAPATRDIDDRNNMEQITIDNPVPGYYAISVFGTTIAQGPQQYFMVYETIDDQITVTYPFGGESFVPGETEVIRWDAFLKTGVFNIEYSIDGGENWTLIIDNVTGGLRQYSWLVPSAITGKALIRISRNGISGLSEAPFSILQQPSDFQIEWACENSVHFSWNEVYGANEYEIYQLGAKYMEIVGSTTSNSYLLTGLNQSNTYWFSIRAKGADEAVSRRITAISKEPGTFNCHPVDGTITEIPSIKWGAYYDEMLQGPQNVTISFKNFGITPIENPVFGYRFSGNEPFTQSYSGSIQPDSTINFTFQQQIELPEPGDFFLKTWVTCSGDDNPANDSLTGIISLISGNPVQVGYMQTFDNWTNCQAIPTCELYMCPLSEGWLNLTNNETDEIDWRTYSGSTPTGITGPETDHTTGTVDGKYLFLEPSVICFFKTAELLLPLIDLTGSISPKAYLWYHAYGSDIGRFHVDVFNGSEIITDLIAPVIGQVGNEWKEMEIDLSNFAGQKIALKLRGVTGGGQKGDFAIDDFILTDATGISDQSNSTTQSLKIFPNPTNGMINIILNQNLNKPLMISVYDIYGRSTITQLYPEWSGNEMIDLRDHSKGIYLIKASNTDSGFVSRVVLK